jgi:hypothetical protein
MLGQIMEWFYADLAGIAPHPTGPSFKRILIRPQPVGDVTWVKAAYDSIRGRIACDWEEAGSQFTLHLNIPVNTIAIVCWQLQVAELGQRGPPQSACRYSRLKIPCLL